MVVRLDTQVERFSTTRVELDTLELVLDAFRVKFDIPVAGLVNPMLELNLNLGLRHYSNVPAIAKKLQ